MKVRAAVAHKAGAPLVITRAECDRIVETLDRALASVDFA